LTVHATKTGAPLIVREPLKVPKVVEEWTIELEKKKFGPQFKKDGKVVEAAILATSQEQRAKLVKELEETGKVVVDVPEVAGGKAEISKDLIKIEWTKRSENIREYTPNVIEPSFGIGRILYSLIEHNYWTRGTEGGDESRGVSDIHVSRTKRMGLLLTNLIGPLLSPYGSTDQGSDRASVVQQGLCPPRSDSYPEAAFGRYFEPCRRLVCQHRQAVQPK
jgi:glycyl-tRNA synthetase (class II)